MTQLARGSSHKTCRDIASCLVDGNKISIYEFLVEYVTQTDVAALLNEAYPEFAFRYDIFRRESDHILAPLVDAVKFDASRTLCNVITFMDIPVPDTATITMVPQFHMWHVLCHLIRLLVSSECTEKCLTYIKEEFTPADYTYAISNCSSIVREVFSANEVIAKLARLNTDCSENNGIDLLAQLAAYQCDNAVLQFLTQNVKSAENLSTATHLMAMLRIHQNPGCRLLEASVTLKPKDLRWILTNFTATALEKCLESPGIHMSIANLRVPYKYVLNRNLLNPYVVATLLNRGMRCTEGHVESAAANGNVPVLGLLVAHCRRWNPSRMVRAVKKSKLTDTLKLNTIKWIATYLQSNALPCKVEGDASCVASYKILVGYITHTGKIDRSCKRNC